MENHLELAKKALEILEIDAVAHVTLHEIATTIEEAFPLVASGSEMRLQEIARDVARKIRNKDNIDEIKLMLEELADEYSYSKYWD